MKPFLFHLPSVVDLGIAVTKCQSRMTAVWFAVPGRMQSFRWECKRKVYEMALMELSPLLNLCFSVLKQHLNLTVKNHLPFPLLALVNCQAYFTKNKMNEISWCAWIILGKTAKIQMPWMLWARFEGKTMLPSSSLSSYFPIPLERTITFCEFTLAQSERRDSLSSQFCKRRILKFQYPNGLSRGMMWHVHMNAFPWSQRNLSPGCFVCRSALKTGAEISDYIETFSVMTSCYFLVAFIKLVHSGGFRAFKSYICIV